MTQETPDLRSVGEAFHLHGDFVAGEPYGSGHINDTYLATYDQAGRPVRYIHQRVNERIFRNVPALMENIDRVTTHLRDKLRREGLPGASRRSLSLVRARDGAAFWRDAGGRAWRTYLFIEGARSHDVIERPEQAEQAAYGFGRFQRLLADLPGAPLHETIPAFHDTPSRYGQLQAASAADAAKRRADVRAELDFARSCEPWVARLVDLAARGRLPMRVTHNDTKLNNVLLDDENGEAVCVIDLDTVMPGLTLYDFGDMVRTGTNAAAEDERDLERTFVRMDTFRALVRGYLRGAGDCLTGEELKHLAFSGALITFEIGCRFLTDHLMGDVYFKVHRPNHNRDRCRTQFRLAAEMLRRMEEMEAVVREERTGAGL